MIKLSINTLIAITFIFHVTVGDIIRKQDFVDLCENANKLIKNNNMAKKEAVSTVKKDFVEKTLRNETLAILRGAYDYGNFTYSNFVNATATVNNTLYSSYANLANLFATGYDISQTTMHNTEYIDLSKFITKVMGVILVLDAVSSDINSCYNYYDNSISIGKRDADLPIESVSSKPSIPCEKIPFPDEFDTSKPFDMAQSYTKFAGAMLRGVC